mmetsp:Transcript_162244/g.299428  ORF Transcript_162244/g.299428 Transcript_162244/m.299428 type:complete len:284 (+) Transcript_162244:138-989(+)
MNSSLSSGFGGLGSKSKYGSFSSSLSLLFSGSFSLLFLFSLSLLFSSSLSSLFSSSLPLLLRLPSGAAPSWLSALSLLFFSSMSSPFFSSFSSLFFSSVSSLFLSSFSSPFFSSFSSLFLSFLSSLSSASLSSLVSSFSLLLRLLLLSRAEISWASTSSEMATRLVPRSLSLTSGARAASLPLAVGILGDALADPFGDDSFGESPSDPLGDAVGDLFPRAPIPRFLASAMSPSAPSPFIDPSSLALSSSSAALRMLLLRCCSLILDFRCSPATLLSRLIKVLR